MMVKQQSGFVLQGAQLYVGLAILGVLITISGLLAANLKHQKDMELARVKEAECLQRAYQVPDLRVAPEGNRLNSSDLSRLSVGDRVVAYGYPYQGKRWPGAFFKQLSETGGKDLLSLSLEITSINDSSVRATSPCFPGEVEVPFSNLFDLFVDPYQS